MHFPEFRSTNTARKRTAIALALAATLTGGLLAAGVTQAQAAPSADCRVDAGTGANGRITDPNSNKKFSNIFWCETQEDANVYPPSNAANTQPFGILHKSPAGKQSNYIVCWSSSLPKTKDGFYWMLTEGDAPVLGAEKAFDLDWDASKPANAPENSWKNNKPDASADRWGWVSSRILGIKAGARPLNIDECASGEVGSKVVDPTKPKPAQTASPAVAKTASTSATPVASKAIPAPASAEPASKASSVPKMNADPEVQRLRQVYLDAAEAWNGTKTQANEQAMITALRNYQDAQAKVGY